MPHIQDASRSHVLACNSTLISPHCLLGGSSPQPSAMVAQSVSAKLGLGQISYPFYGVNAWLVNYL